MANRNILSVLKCHALKNLLKFPVSSTKNKPRTSKSTKTPVSGHEMAIWQGKLVVFTPYVTMCRSTMFFIGAHWVRHQPARLIAKTSNSKPWTVRQVLGCHAFLTMVNIMDAWDTRTLLSIVYDCLSLSLDFTSEIVTCADIFRSPEKRSQFSGIVWLQTLISPTPLKVKPWTSG